MDDARGAVACKRMAACEWVGGVGGVAGGSVEKEAGCATETRSAKTRHGVRVSGGGAAGGECG
jgi:hypothetical protein